MEEHADARLLSAMHEAAFVPEKWVSFIDEVTDATASGSGALGIYWPAPRGISGTRTIAGVPAQEWDQPLQDRKTWEAYVRSKSLINSGFVTIEIGRDWNDISDYQRRVDGITKRNVGSQLGAIYELFNGELITVEVARARDVCPYTAQDVARMNRFDAHLKRSMLFASRFHFERARGSIDAMKIVGIPAFLVGSGNRVLHSNALADEIKGVLISLPGETLAINGDERAKCAFAKALSPSCEDSVSIPIAETAQNDAAIVHIMPVLGSARDIFASSFKMVLVTTLGSGGRVPKADCIVNMFGLTPAEANLAVSLASGLSLRDSAAKSKIGIGTARSYLLRIYSKTQTHQQSQLVSVLMKLSL
jgi:DNA-binding CsgD family transcriptional regulator